MAMTAAETGHLVLGTLHTTSAVKTIDRIIDALPVEEREQTKSFLSQSLLAVVTQVLVKTADAAGRRGGLRGHGDDQGHRQADHDRPDAPDCRASCRPGGTSACSCMDMALLAAIQAKEIDPDDAFAYAVDKRPFHERSCTDTEHACRKLDARRRPSAERTQYAHGRRIDEYLREVLTAKRLGPAFRRRRPAAHPPVRRPAAAAPGAARRGIRARSAVRDHAAQGGGALRGEGRRRLRLHAAGRGALPRQRHAPPERHGRGVPRHPVARR